MDIIIIIKRGRQCKAGSAIIPTSPKIPAPQYEPIERRESENSRRQKGSEQLTPIKKDISPVLKTRQSLTIDTG